MAAPQASASLARPAGAEEGVMDEQLGGSEVASFYTGKTLFITGATGFLGKVLLEKLLRSCSGVRRVYVLARPRKDVSAQDRMDDILKSVLFDRLREEQPDFAGKVQAMRGDMIEPRMGLCEQDLGTLRREVNAVIHCAATVKFDEKLKLALQMNVTGVEQLLGVARSFEKLEALVHTSTAYANCDRPHIEERVYEPVVDPSRLRDALEWMTDEHADGLTAPLVGKRPNTYTLTKSLAEALVLKDSRECGYPIAIMRPSIVGAIADEPLPGWCDNLNGPGGLYLACGKGVLRVMRGDPQAVADIVPVDMCANMLLAICWHTARTRPAEPLVFNCTSGAANPLYWQKNNEYVQEAFTRYPLEDVFRRPNFAHVPSLAGYRLWTFFSHYLPALVADSLATAVGRRRRMVRIYGKLQKLTEAYYYFTSHNWTWEAGNGERLLNNHMSEQDRALFSFNMRAINWPRYIEAYCLGIKKFILKEDFGKLARARLQHRRLRAGRIFFTCLACAMLWRVAYRSYIRSRAYAKRPSLFFFLNPFSPLVVLAMRLFKVPVDPLALPYAPTPVYSTARA